MCADESWRVGRLRIASSMLARLRGLFVCERDFAGVLLIVPCRSIHTFWMRRPIDVAFVAADGRVLDSQRRLAPWRIASCKRAHATLERFASDDPWFEKDQHVQLHPASSP